MFRRKKYLLWCRCQTCLLRTGSTSETMPNDQLHRTLRLPIVFPGAADTKRLGPGVAGIGHLVVGWAYETPVISRSPDVMGGTPVFAGTRVPVQTLLDYLEAGESIDDFLAGFPSVNRGQVIAFLEEAKDQLVASST